MSGILPESPAGWIGYGVAFLTALGAVIRDRRKSDIDESALVLGKWKELVEQHQADIKGIREEFSAYRAVVAAERAATAIEMTGLRDRLAGAEKRIGELEVENAGLRRSIAQNSQSTVHLLGRTSGAEGDNDVTDRLDRAGGNLRKGME